MFFKLNEIMTQSQVYILFCRSKKVFEKKYQITTCPHQTGAETIFAPTAKGYKNDCITNGAIETVLAKGTGAFLFAEDYFNDPEYHDIIINLAKNENIELILISKKNLTATIEDFTSYAIKNKISKNTKIALITGTNGISDTNRALSCVLSQKYKVYNYIHRTRSYTELLNAVLSVDENYDFLIFDCPMLTRNYFNVIPKIFKPDIILITDIRFYEGDTRGIKSQNELVQRKLNVMSGSNKNTIVILDDCYEEKSKIYEAQKIFTKNEVVFLGDTKFEYKNIEYETLKQDKITNIIKVIELAQKFRVKPCDIQKGLKSLKVDKHYEKCVEFTASSDEKYIKYVKYLLHSIMLNASKENKYIFHYFINNIKPESLNKILDLQKLYTNLEIITYDRNVLNVPSLCDHGRYTQSAFDRLMLSDFFKDKNKILYLDCDLFVMDDIEKLYSHNIEDYCAGVCLDIGLVSYVKNKVTHYKFAKVKYEGMPFDEYVKNILGMKNPEKMFNSGVMLFNLEKFRKENIAQKCIDFINKVEPIFPDQCALNKYLEGKVLYVHPTWNANIVGCCRSKSPVYEGLEPKIIHGKIPLYKDLLGKGNWENVPYGNRFKFVLSFV